MKTNLKSGKKLISCIIIACMLTSVLPCIIANANEKIQNQTIAIGWDHYAMIKEDGSLWTWGSNAHGGLGNGTTEYSDIPVNIMNDVISVSLGDEYSAAIKADGSLWMWGDNGAGQLGDKTSEDRYTPVKIMDDVKSVSTGRNVVAAIKTDGSLWTWGAKTGFYSEQLGNDSERYSAEDYCTPMKIMDDVLSIFIGDEHCAAIKTDGSLWMWGDNLHGELGNGSTEDSYVPIKIMEDILSTSLGDYNSAVIKTDGSLWIWGSNLYKLVENTRTDIITTPTKITEDVKSVSVGDEVCVVIKNNGTLWGWGNDTYEALGNGEGNDSAYGYENAIKILDDIDSVVARGRAVAALSKDGFLWIWGDSDMTEPLQIATNVMIPKAINNINSAPKEPTKNNPVVSDTTPQTITLGEEKWLNTYIDGIYSEVSENDFSVKSSNSDVINIVNQQTYCGGISNPFDETDIAYLTSVDMYVKGANIGTTTLTYYYQNKEIGKINVTVEPVIADTISDELVLKAKICADNPTYKYMIDTFNNPATLYNNSSSSVAAQMVTDLNGFIDAFSLEFDSKNYYEAVLMDMVTSDTFYDTVKDSLYIDDIEFAVDKLNTVGSFAEDEINKLLSDEIKKGFDVDKFFNDISILDTVITAKDSFDAMNDKYKQLTALCLVSEEQICALEQLKDISAVPELTEACDTVIKAVKDANEKAVNKIAAGVFEGVEELFENVGQYGWDSLISLVPGVNAAKAIVASAQLVSNGLFNQDELSNDILLMNAVSVIDGYMDFKVKNTETLFTDYPTRDNAVRFMACANFYKSLCKYGCKATENFFKHYDEAFVTKMTGNNQSDRIDIVQYIAESIDDWNLYDSTGLDISKYLRNVVSETPSEWAKEYVEKAKNYGFLWPDMQNNYQNNITRAEFCMLLYNTMALKDTVKFEEIINSANKKITVEFDDVLFYYVTQVAKMGIINGTGNNKFEPLGEITREQAAKMLCAAAEVMGYDTTAPQTDLTGVSDWAKEGANFVVNSGIMTGTDNGFEPQGTYTKEQAITTMVRFFENLK